MSHIIDYTEAQRLIYGFWNSFVQPKQNNIPIGGKLLLSAMRTNYTVNALEPGHEEGCRFWHCMDAELNSLQNAKWFVACEWIQTSYYQPTSAAMGNILAAPDLNDLISYPIGEVSVASFLENTLFAISTNQFRDKSELLAWVKSFVHNFQLNPEGVAFFANKSGTEEVQKFETQVAAANGSVVYFFGYDDRLTANNLRLILFCADSTGKLQLADSHIILERSRP